MLNNMKFESFDNQNFERKSRIERYKKKVERKIIVKKQNANIIFGLMHFFISININFFTIYNHLLN